jgi:hypothetical protein
MPRKLRRPSMVWICAFACALTLASSLSAQAPGESRVAETLYENDFESGSGALDWTLGVLRGTGGNSWQGVQSCTANSGDGIFRFGGSTCSGVYTDDQLTYAHPPAIAVPAGATDTRLSFWHRWSFEEGHDGGKVSVAIDGGDIFYFTNNDDILSGATENGTTGTDCPPGNLLPPFSVFSGDSADFQNSFQNTVIDLDSVCDRALSSTGGCAGHSLRIGFLGVADCSTGGEGWFLDDVRVTVENPLELYTLAPCRVIDTRQPDDALAGPALQPGTTRTFTVAGSCGIPATARAVAVNLTVVQPEAVGYLTALPADQTAVTTSSINFRPGQVRANNAILSLDEAGAVGVFAGTAGTLHFVMDVTGYFE